jgi:membrane protease YdiL (CAAX protease family)
MAVKFIETKEKKKFSRRDLLMVFCALLIAGVSLVFPQKAYGEAFWLSFFLFAVFPAATIILLFKNSLKNFGLTWGNQKKGAIFSFAIVIIFVFANYYILHHTKYGGQLSIARGIIGSFTVFLLFEFFIILPLHFFSEFFFRGFLQLGLEKKLGISSLFIAAALQTALSFRSSWAMILLVLFSSLSAGLIVRQSRSILYTAISLWLI